MKQVTDLKLNASVVFSKKKYTPSLHVCPGFEQVQQSLRSKTQLRLTQIIYPLLLSHLHLQQQVKQS